MKNKYLYSLSMLLATSVSSFATDYVYAPPSGDTITGITPGYSKTLSME